MSKSYITDFSVMMLFLREFINNVGNLFEILYKKLLYKYLSSLVFYIFHYSQQVIDTYVCM